MAALVGSKEIEQTVRTALRRQGYDISVERGYGETGADIVATKGDDELHIEAIAFKQSPPARAKDFYEVFFRAVSRIEVGATQCIIALPARFGMGLRQRADAIGCAWARIGAAFPELSIWLVDSKDGSIKRTSWNSWKS